MPPPPGWPRGDSVAAARARARAGTSSSTAVLFGAPRPALAEARPPLKQPVGVGDDDRIVVDVTALSQCAARRPRSVRDWASVGGEGMELVGLERKLSLPRTRRTGRTE
jgi:hypothetical protein